MSGEGGKVREKKGRALSINPPSDVYKSWRRFLSFPFLGDSVTFVFFLKLNVKILSSFSLDEGG